MGECNMTGHGGGASLEKLTADATATAGDIISGKTAYAKGVKLSGTAQRMKTKATVEKYSGSMSISINSFNGTELNVYYGYGSLHGTATIKLE